MYQVKKGTRIIKTPKITKDRESACLYAYKMSLLNMGANYIISKEPNKEGFRVLIGVYQNGEFRSHINKNWA